MSSLEAPYVLQYTWRRSTGAVIGRFLAGLRDRRIQGMRAPDGRVIVPPHEHDPSTGEPLSEWVDVADSGEVTAWAWVAEPRRNHPLAVPFAFALVRLDGASTAMLHAVDAGDPARMRTGMRVRARWREERSGAVTDIACFEPAP